MIIITFWYIAHTKNIDMLSLCCVTRAAQVAFNKIRKGGCYFRTNYLVLLNLKLSHLLMEHLSLWILKWWGHVFFCLFLLNILVVDRLINAGEETLMFKLNQIIYDFSCGIHLKKKNNKLGVLLGGWFRRNEGKCPGMDGIWYLLKITTMRNSTTQNRVFKDTKKPAIKSFNLILKIAGSEENGLTISNIDYTCFCSRENFSKTISYPLFRVCVCIGGISVCLFTPHTHIHLHITKAGFWSIKPKAFERQGGGQESEEIVKMFLAHFHNSVSIIKEWTMSQGRESWIKIQNYLVAQGKESHSKEK